MRPVRVTISSVTTSAVVPLDVNQDPFNVGLAVDITGTATYTVQYTFEDVQAAGWTAGSAKWFDHPSMTAQTADKDSNLAFPCTAVRLNCTAYTSGTLTMTVLQATAAR